MCSQFWNDRSKNNLDMSLFQPSYFGAVEWTKDCWKEGVRQYLPCQKLLHLPKQFSGVSSQVLTAFTHGGQVQQVLGFSITSLLFFIPYFPNFICCSSCFTSCISQTVTSVAVAQQCVYLPVPYLLSFFFVDVLLYVLSCGTVYIYIHTYISCHHIYVVIS